MKIKKIFLRAIFLAESVKGGTSPNPAVGCVVVSRGAIVGEGATQMAGGAHAEVVALTKAGSRAKGSELYVTLEPCVDFPGKKTPSCTDAIIRAGIKRVYIGMKDPNPDINGRGIKKLKRAGISVVIVKEYENELKKLNEDYMKYIQTGLPFVYAKCAMTLDGNIADLSGDSKWISSEESRKWVHNLRNRVDCIMVGVGTIIKDNPSLNVRYVKNKKKDPIRIVIDPEGKTPFSSRVMMDSNRTIFVVNKGIGELFKKTVEKNHKELIEFECEKNVDGKSEINLKKLIAYLGRERGIESILIEGGGKLFYQAIKYRVVDKMIIFIAPKIFGGVGTPFLNGKALFSVRKALKVKDISVENIGEDLLVQGYL